MRLSLSLLAGSALACTVFSTAASAQADKVDVLPLDPALSTPVQALRSSARAQSVHSRAFTRCMQQALQQLG